MKTTNRVIIGAVVAGAIALVALVVTVVLNLNGGDSIVEGAGTDAHVLIDEASDAIEPDAVAQNALAAIFTWQPTVDESPGSAMQRAEEWLTGHLAESAGAPRDPNVRLPAQWSGWRSSKDIVSATAAPQEAVVRTDTKAIIPVTVTQTVLHTDGSSTPYTTNTVRAVVVQTSDGWKLSEFSLMPSR